MALSLRSAARTNVGLGSKNRNEDSAYAGPELLVLADGMGGHAGGDTASSLVIGELVPLDGDASGGDDMLSRLAEAIARANTLLRETMDSDPELDGMGTTLIAMMRSGSKLAMATIGDSRAYLVREGRFRQISKDHSFVQTLLDEGRITEDEALHHPQRSLVTRVLTGRHEDVPDLSLREIRKGDRYILCSDGLTDYVSPETLEEIATAKGTPGAIADNLIDLALRAATRDNVTVVVADAVSADASYVNAPEVVGAVAKTRPGQLLHSTPRTPAEKAAALTRQVNQPPTPTVVEEELDDRGRPLLAEESRRGNGWRRLVGVLALLAVLGGVLYAGYAWTQQQYYVGEHDGKVAIYRGVPQDLGPISLHSHLEDEPLAVIHLPSFARQQVRDTLSASSADQARDQVANLRRQAEQCIGQDLARAMTGCPE